MFSKIKNDLKIDEVKHKYYLEDDPSIDFISCTTFIYYFFKKFDTIGIANKLTATHPKYMDMTPQELVAQWDIIANEGTEIHKEIELFIKSKVNPSSNKGKNAVKWLNSLNLDKYEIYSEAIIYSKEIEIAGTVDLLIYDKETKTLDICDWKTSRQIETTSFGSKKGTTAATSHLLDCNFNHYSLQLSLYAYILENSYNFQINKLKILHLTDYNTVVYECKYMKDIIQKMLTYDRKELAKIAEDSLTKEFIINE